MRLSDTQIDLLAEISNGKVSEIYCQMHAGRSWRKTVAALEARGLIVHQPYAFKGEGAYAITDAGEDEIAELKRRGKVVVEETATDEHGGRDIKVKTTDET